MFTYQVRQRVFRVADGTKPFVFPSDCTIRFHFWPQQPFGESAGGGRTAVQSKPATAFFDANTGNHSIESKEPLQPLDVRIEEGSMRNIVMTGTILSVSQKIDSNTELTDLIQGLYLCLPILINVDFADPPIITRVDGSVGGRNFRWELNKWSMEFEITTQERQGQAIFDAWRRIVLLKLTTSRRMISALHYFHVAVRLNRIGAMPGEFLSEYILNLSKILDALFRANKNHKQPMAIRKGLRLLGFDDKRIEAEFMPANTLRNKIDSGHVFLSLLTEHQLEVIHEYTDKAERSFRELLKTVMSAIEKGVWTLPQDSKEIRSKDTDKIIDELERNMKSKG
jgi:hypothetical protein